jgi:hypothetical protein
VLLSWPYAFTAPVPQQLQCFWAVGHSYSVDYGSSAPNLICHTFLAWATTESQAGCTIFFPQSKNVKEQSNERSGKEIDI